MPPTIHRRLAYVPSEANLWPALTGAEVLRFLADIHGSVDAAYRDELVRALRPGARQEDPRVQPRQPAEGGADRRVREPGRPAAARRADDRTRSADGAGLPRVRARGARPRSDGPAVVAHLERGRSGVRPRRDAARRAASSRPAGSRCCGAWPRCACTPSSTVRRPICRAVPGVSNVVVDGNTVECDVTGSMEPLLQALAATGVRRLTTREPSLEELFISHYGNAATGAGTRAMTSGVLVEPRATPAAPRGRRGRVDLAIARRAFKQLWISATVWALVFGGTIAASGALLREQLPGRQRAGSSSRRARAEMPASRSSSDR